MIAVTQDRINMRLLYSSNINIPSLHASAVRPSGQNTHFTPSVPTCVQLPLSLSKNNISENSHPLGDLSTR